MMKLKKSYCSVLYCRNNSITHPDLSFFRIPKFPVRAAIWLKNIHRENTTIKKVLVCEMHFEPRYVSANESRKRLISAAIPTLNLPYTVRYQYEPDSELPDFCTIGTQTVDTYNNSNMEEDAIVAFTHIIKMEREEVPEFESEIDIEETHVAESECSSEVDCDVNLSQIIALYDTIKEKSKDEEYSLDFKFFALQLYFTSPKTYKVLQKTLKLPTVSDLYRLCLPTSTEITENILRALKLRVNAMTDEQRQCAVCIGTMTLKPNLFYDKNKDKVIGFHEVDGVQALEPAKFLFIVMVRGLFHDWKQVVTYSLLATNHNYRDVKTQIDKVFEKLFGIGLHVRVLISDMESEVMSATLDRKITPELPYFFINSHKIYYMFDPPHIIRAVWESLPNNDFKIGDNAVIQWKYISEFYEIDKSRSVKLAPKLSDGHMKPKYFGSDTVSVAAQVFSNTTAAGISACIDMKLLDGSAKHTVDCLSKFNKLFDMLNFSSFADKKQNIFCGEQSQVDFLRETMFWLDQMRLISNGKEVNCAVKTKFVRAYKITINTILSLYEHFKIENRSLVRPRFTRDCIDTFIMKVHAKHAVEPTCKAITRIIKTLPIFSIFQWVAHKRGSDDFEEFLKLANHVSKIQIYKSKVESVPPFYGLAADVDFSIELPQKGRLQYIASYLLHEASLRYSNCVLFNEYVLKHSEKNDAKVAESLANDRSATDREIPISAPPEFIEIILLLDSKIQLHFQSQTVVNPILASLVKSVDDVDFINVTRCERAPLKFMKELYVANRFNSLLNFNNDQLRNCKKCQSSFTVQDYYLHL